jgi:hypothetical protein
MFHSSSYACVVVFEVCDVSPLPSDGGITSTYGEDKIFLVDGVVGV